MEDFNIPGYNSPNFYSVTETLSTFRPVRMKRSSSVATFLKAKRNRDRAAAKGPFVLCPDCRGVGFVLNREPEKPFVLCQNCRKEEATLENNGRNYCQRCFNALYPF